MILDIKTPGSGEVDANVWSNLDRLKPIDEVKVVICAVVPISTGPSKSFARDG